MNHCALGIQPYKPAYDKDRQNQNACIRKAPPYPTAPSPDSHENAEEKAP
jgi:hypothetical protein